MAILKSAREAQLGAVESAIQRELEEVRIGTQLEFDLLRAAGDAEATAKAHERALEAGNRLTDQRELAAMNEAAEELVRARYADQIEAIEQNYSEQADLRDQWFGEDTAATEEHYEMMIGGEQEIMEEQLAEWDYHYTKKQDAVKAFYAEAIEDWEAHYDEQIAALTGNHERSLSEWDAYYDKLIAEVQSGVAAINAANAGLEDRTVTITTVHESAQAPVAGKRADGGPVGAGNTYLVGERGPEYFTPSQPGYITPNDGGKADARMIGREVAKALQESPISIPQDAVTDSVLRAAPGREALRGWA